MADPHGRSISYSALPVFSGDIMLPPTPSELLAPRRSGIPLLVNTTRRHASAAGTPSPRADLKSIPKSHSLRAIPIHARLPQRQAAAPAQLYGQGPTSASSVASNTSVGSVTSLNGNSSISSASSSTSTLAPQNLRLRPRHSPAAVAAAAAAPAATGVSLSPKPAKQLRKVSVPACANVPTISSAAKAIPKSTSSKSISKRLPSSSSISGLARVNARVGSNPQPQEKQRRKLIRVPLAQQNGAQAESQTPTQIQTQTQTQTKAQTQTQTQMQPLQLSQASKMHTPSQPAARPQHQLAAPHASQVRPLPSAQSVPFNLSLRKQRLPSLDTRSANFNYGPPPSIQPDSARSSRSSQRSFTEATQRFFGKIRSAASSRASGSRGSGTPKGSPPKGTPIESTFPMPPQLDDWEDVVIEREPAPATVQHLLALTKGASNLSKKIDSNFIRQGTPGLQLSKTSATLTRTERLEILNYQNVYFTGHPGIKKVTGNFTDEQGNYKSVLHDHIGYRYEVLAEVGKGSFGKVFKCRDYKTGRMIALKVTCNRPEMRHQSRVEAKLLATLVKAGKSDKHHFLRYIGSFTFRDHFCICTEILGDNLYDLLRRNKFHGLDYDLVRYITRQLVEGLEFLDLQGIIHCDLKPENILISNASKCQVKIIDFGSGCIETNRVYTYIQSRFYRSPEILLGVPYSTAIDMWSLGCIVPELLVGKPLFPGEDEVDQIACLCQAIGSPDAFMLKSCSRANLFFDARGNPLVRRSPEGKVRGVPGSQPLDTILDPLAADFVSKLLKWSPHKRLSAGGALFHEFILGI